MAIRAHWYPEISMLAVLVVGQRVTSINLRVMLNGPPRTIRKWDQLRKSVHRWAYLPYGFIYIFMPTALLFQLFYPVHC